MNGLVHEILPGSNKTDVSTHADSSSANGGEMRDLSLIMVFFVIVKARLSSIVRGNA